MKSVDGVDYADYADYGENSDYRKYYKPAHADANGLNDNRTMSQFESDPVKPHTKKSSDYLLIMTLLFFIISSIVLCGFYFFPPDVNNKMKSEIRDIKENLKAITGISDNIKNLNTIQAEIQTIKDTLQTIKDNYENNQNSQILQGEIQNIKKTLQTIRTDNNQNIQTLQTETSDLKKSFKKLVDKDKLLDESLNQYGKAMLDAEAEIRTVKKTIKDNTDNNENIHAIQAEIQTVKDTLHTIKDNSNNDQSIQMLKTETSELKKYFNNLMDKDNLMEKNLNQQGKAILDAEGEIGTVKNTLQTMKDNTDNNQNIYLIQSETSDLKKSVKTLFDKDDQIQQDLNKYDRAFLAAEAKIAQATKTAEQALKNTASNASQNPESQTIGWKTINGLLKDYCRAQLSISEYDEVGKRCKQFIAASH